MATTSKTPKKDEVETVEYQLSKEERTAMSNASRSYMESLALCALTEKRFKFGKAPEFKPLMIILGGSAGVHLGDTVGKARSKAILDTSLPPSSQLKELLERKRRSDFILKILPPRADKVLDSTGDSAEVQQEESKHSTSASAGVEDIEIQVPVSTKWKELSWESPESSPVSIDSNRDASTKEQQRSDRTGLRELNPSESSTRDTTELQMFVDEDEEDEPQDTSVNFTPPVLAKESSRRRPGKEAPKSSTLYDEDDYY